MIGGGASAFWRQGQVGHTTTGAKEGGLGQALSTPTLTSEGVCRPTEFLCHTGAAMSLRRHHRGVSEAFAFAGELYCTHCVVAVVFVRL